MSDTIKIEEIDGRIDFAVLTIRDDEFRAVLDRFKPSRTVLGGKLIYEFATLTNRIGEEITVVVSRTIDQGHGAAQTHAHSIISDLSPSWLVLAGIAGGCPDKEFTLGDVLLASRLIDFSVTAAIQDEGLEFRTTGGPMHRDVERLLGWLPAKGDTLGPWNSNESLNAAKPRIELPSSTEDTSLYGPTDFRKKVLDAIEHHFPSNGDLRPPIFRPDVLATSNVLLKQYELLEEWKKAARQISHVEMEAGGVYHAARHGGEHEIPLLCVRGISDIVGYKRSGEWTNFACQSAAALFQALLIQLPRDVWGNSLSNSRQISVGPESARESTMPTVGAMSAAFKQSSQTLMSMVVDDDERIERVEENEIESTLNEKTTALLLGPPGSGKTCLLAKVAQDATDRGLVTLALKADMFPHDLCFGEWGRRVLDLDVALFDAVKAVSTNTSVLVVVDQLDALASTVDLTSSRLNEIVEFVARCSELPNVSVLCSCRDFDYTYDTRFRRLNSKTISLALPTWESVSERLTSQGIPNANDWSDEFKEVLRTPQHLGVFLRSYSDTGNVSPFDSYQTMLGDSWSRAVVSNEERQLLQDLTKKLVATESIWTPLVSFQECSSTITALQAKGILRTEDQSLGFAHQTLLEYAKARFFTESEVSLCTFVLESGRQDSVLVRPTVWSVLTYLRRADERRYREEIERLFSSELRLHLRFLLIDFVCRQDKPHEFEVALIGVRLSQPDERTRILIAIRGKERWFRAFHATHFPDIMRLEPYDQWPMVALVSESWDFAFSECLKLVTKHWLPHEKFDQLTHRVIRECGRWTGETIAVVNRLIDRDNSDEAPYWIEDLVATVSASAPEKAGALFVRAMTRIESNLDASDRSPSRYDSPIERSKGWYDLPEIAKASPSSFLSDAWPWAVKAIQKHHKEHVGSVLYSYAGYCLAMEENEWRRESSVLTAIDAAIDAVSQDDPKQFIEITEPTWRSENAVVHRLICRGLVKCARSHPGKCLDYLLGDRRRMSVGRYAETRQSDSVAVIKAIYPALDKSEQTRLLNAIRSWSKYRDDVDQCEDQKKWDREDRLHLLSAIPGNLQSPELASQIADEKIAIPEWDRERIRSRSGFVRQIPPMTTDEMRSASDAEIVDAFSKPTVDRSMRERKEIDGGWEEPGDATACEGELAELTKENPRRGMAIMRTLANAGRVQHVGRAFRALGESDIASQDIFDFIVEIEPYGRTSEDFRYDASFMLYHRSERKIGLPDEICDLLEEWLQMPWDHESSTLVKSDPKPWEGKETILWERTGGILDTDKSFFTLMALTAGLLDGTPPDFDEWIRVLTEHLSREVSSSTWQTFCPELRWLRLETCDRDDARTLLTTVFSKFPSLPRTASGLRLIAYVSDLLEETEMQTQLRSMRNSDDALTQQGYGELLTVLAMREDEHRWASEWLDAELASVSGNAALEPVAVGIGFAASRLWSELDQPGKASSILVQLLRSSSEKVWHATGTVFWMSKSIEAGEPTEKLLGAFANYPLALDARATSEMLEHACAILPHCRSAILRVCQALVETRYEELKQMGFDAYTVGPSLVEVSMTLQRFQDTRSGGLALLENLLRAGLDDADAVLDEVDLHPKGTKSKPRRPRRKRRRKS
ncbi:phosphorylase family protein [Aporhodopirellula rubra]|uniref:phosphorylase family protein n=1 Tax=Aporhodopirellula rubra TaxID=980271 RepID=UPI0016117B8C|nr:AAA family ATPase [Aporhodopirellula rubra]